MSIMKVSTEDRVQLQGKHKTNMKTMDPIYIHKLLDDSQGWLESSSKFHFSYILTPQYL